jgi:predicted GNAT family N-acyltransferase
MLVELKFLCTPDRLTTLRAPDLLGLTQTLSLPNRQESIASAVEFLTDAEALCNSLKKPGGTNGKRRACIIISPDLVEAGTDTVVASTLSKRLLLLSWEHNVLLGLIGLTPDDRGHVSGIDEVIATYALNLGILRSAVEKVTTRLWLKLPPLPRVDTQRPADAFVVQQITQVGHFRQSLALRYRMYQTLGYLQEQIANSQLKIEMDGYDPAAIHFLVSPADDPSHLAGSMRIVMPGWQHLPRASAFLQAVDYGTWCEALANEETAPVFRRILNRPANHAFPLLGCFDYFEPLMQEPLYREMIMPQHSCELSRVVVQPEYRGHGLLKLLMDKVISVCKRMGKRYLLLECAPFHADMYAKFGFTVIEDRGRRYYSRAQRLDTWAVAMYLDLTQVQSMPAPQPDIHLAQPSNAVYELTVAKPLRLLRITGIRMQPETIRDRLQAPYQLPRRALERREFIAKGAHPTLATLVQNALTDLDGYLGELLGEVFQRLPGAQLTLIDNAGRELRIDEAQCVDPTNALALYEIIGNWLEEHHVAA